MLELLHGCRVCHRLKAGRFSVKKGEITQRPVRPTASEIASKHRNTRFVGQLMHINRSAKPRVPSIKNLEPIDNVGVLAFSCTTLSDRTALWDTVHRQPKASSW